MNRLVKLISAATFALFVSAAFGVDVGDEAPLFELPDTDGNVVKLIDYRENPAVVVFYRGFF